MGYSQGYISLTETMIATPPDPPDPPVVLVPTKFVSTGGSDSNAGTSVLSPWRTTEWALRHCAPSDVIAFRGGSYVTANDTLSAFVAGTALAPISIIPYQGEPVTFTSDIVYYNAANPCRYHHWYDVRFQNGSYSLFGAQGSHHISFTRCYVQNALKNSVEIGNDQSHDWLFDGCTFDHGGNDINYDHNLYISAPRTTIRNCDIFLAASCGMQMFNGYPGENVDDCVVTGNRFFLNGRDDGTPLTVSASAIMIYEGANHFVANNVIYNNRLIGICIAAQAVNVKVYHNTVYGGQYGIMAEAGATGYCRNNLSGGNPGGNFIDASAGGVVFSHNYSGNPGWVNPNAANFHLTAGASAARGQGLYLAEVPTDFDGVTRANPPDLGAYQYV